AAATGAAVLSDETKAGFDAEGSDGKAAARLAEKGSPDSEALRNAAAQAQGVDAGDADSQKGSAALLGLAAASNDGGGDDGLGTGLPLLLGLKLPAALGVPGVR